MKRIIGVCLMLAAIGAAQAQSVSGRVSFNSNWRFKLNEKMPAFASSLNDANWRQLTLPHDWSIELPFDKDSPTGNGGGALRGGLGWYRKTFATPAGISQKKVFLEFDGVYMNSEVYVNGKLAGVRPNGYISFRYDITALLKAAGEQNTVAVKVDNSKQPNSRWYSGSGIYRSVWLTISDKVHVAQWGVHTTTPSVNKTKALLNIEASVQNENSNPVVANVENILLDENGNVAGKSNAQIQIKPGGVTKNTAVISVVNPALWAVINPHLYKLVTNISVNGKITESYETAVGFRWFRFDAQNGFFLNDQPLKIRGVCMHHDLGGLGTAMNRTALRRQIEILQEMGCNAIRTSHNPPAPELLELCDEMGVLVMDEAFDMWKKEKTQYDYSTVWDKWHVKDLKDQILRDRNHPSVIMWSLGNEIIEQDGPKHDSSGKTILRELYAIQKQLDPSRPAVTANNRYGKQNQLLQSGAYDVIGYNYNEKTWKDAVKEWGNKPFIVTESVSSLHTRGSYDMPSDSIRVWPERWDKEFTLGNSDTTCSAYDNCRTPWGTTHEKSLLILEQNASVSGMFVWTGFDYIGEPTPYSWPARSSYFGIVDLAGFPKDVYYLYQSVWTNKPVLHIFPHWNWKAGQDIDVWAYYNNADEVELFLNGKSLGIRKKGNDEMHVVWRVKYAPGTLKAVSRKNGNIVLTKEIHTAGNATQLAAVAEKPSIKAAADALAFIQVSVNDADGNLVPHANSTVTFSVEGPGFVAAVDNGNQISMESFKSNSRKAFNGKCMAMIQSTGQPGVIKVKLNAPGLKAAEVTINVE